MSRSVPKGSNNTKGLPARYKAIVIWDPSKIKAIKNEIDNYPLINQDGSIRGARKTPRSKSYKVEQIEYDPSCPALTKIQKDLLHCLWDNKGVILDAIADMKGEATLGDHMEGLRNPVYCMLFDAIDQYKLDLAERALYEKALEGHTQLLPYYLNNKAKSRGYSNETNINVNKQFKIAYDDSDGVDREGQPLIDYVADTKLLEGEVINDEDGEILDE